MVESDAEAVSATSLGVQVQYCNECSMPFEYCEYGPLYEKKCKANLMQHAPHLLAGKLSEDESEMMKRLQLESSATANGSSGAAASEPAAPTAAPTAASNKKKGSKASGAVYVLVSRMARKGKKCTYIQNLDAFGVNPKQSAKSFQSKFACGSSVQKGPPPGVLIQGDVLIEVATYIHQKLKIPQAHIMIHDMKKNISKPAFD